MQWAQCYVIKEPEHLYPEKVNRHYWHRCQVPEKLTLTKGAEPGALHLACQEHEAHHDGCNSTISGSHDSSWSKVSIPSTLGHDQQSPAKSANSCQVCQLPPSLPTPAKSANSCQVCQLLPSLPTPAKSANSCQVCQLLPGLPTSAKCTISYLDPQSLRERVHACHALCSTRPCLLYCTVLHPRKYLIRINRTV